MRRLTPAFAILAGVLATLGVVAQTNPPAKPLQNVLPNDIVATAFALTPDASRTYFLNASGEVWFFDHTSKTSTRVATGPAWDLSVSAARNAIAYTRRGDAPNDRFVWISPLDPKTGLAVGEARRVSAAQSDMPALSPDGRWIAFARDEAGGVTQRLVVAPVAGGAERAVSAPVPSIDHVRWTPDSASLYFGVNPPVPCVPEWSCLPLGHDDSKGPISIRRVALGGGPETTIIRAIRSGSFGLSPDGSIIVHGDTNNARLLDITDADGHALGSFTPSPNQTIVGWLNGAALMARSSGTARRLNLTAIAGGSPRFLFELPTRIVPPVWSPDGKTIAAFRCPGSAPCELRLLSADGSPQRALPLTDTNAVAPAWSPDGRWLSYTGTAPSQNPQLKALEFATGRVVELGVRSPNNVIWMPDSRRMVITEVAAGPVETRRASISTIDFERRRTTLGDVLLGEPPSGAITLDDVKMLVLGGAKHNLRMRSIDGSGAERELFAGVDMANAVPTVSDDRQWLGVRRMSSSGASGFDTIDICRVNGAERTTMSLPFMATGTPNGLVILPGAKQVVVVEAAARPDIDPGIYLVTMATKTVKKLFSIPGRTARSGMPELSVSPDGRTLAYSVSESVATSVSALDMSVFRQPGR